MIEVTMLAADVLTFFSGLTHLPGGVVYVGVQESAFVCKYVAKLFIDHEKQTIYSVTLPKCQETDASLQTIARCHSLRIELSNSHCTGCRKFVTPAFTFVGKPKREDTERERECFVASFQHAFGPF